MTDLVEAPESSLVQKLMEHERAWAARPLLRAVYREWFELMAANLASVEGLTVELGSGLGHFRDVVPGAVATDIQPTPWADAVVDAERLPYSDETVANLVLLDVFHHLPRPVRFLDEASRVLRPGGRVVMIEPYCSPVSTLAYKASHHETVDLRVDPFRDAPQSSDDAMDANTALPTLFFFSWRDRFAERWPALRIVEAKRLAVVAHPLSGGFSKRQLVPAGAWPALRRLEKLFTPLAPLAGFRCFVVLERQ